MEKRHILAVFAVFTTLLWTWAVFAFHEQTAAWFGISIWVYAIFLALAFVGVAAWFRLLSIDDTTPRLVLAILALFVVVSFAEGVFISEPSLVSQPSSNHTAASSGDHDGGSTNFFYYYWHESTTSTSSSSSSSSSSNSKGGGYVILVLLLIALLLLSAIIPHFWVVAVFIGMILLWCFTVKEFRRAQATSYSPY